MIKTSAGRKKTAASKPLHRVTENHQAFWVNNGPIIHDLKELEQSLLSMADATFAYHVNQHKNDFAKWVSEALNNSEVGKKLQRSKTKTAFLKVLQQTLKEVK
jgi:hypothetical protein